MDQVSRSRSPSPSLRMLISANPEEDEQSASSSLSGDADKEIDEQTVIIPGNTQDHLSHTAQNRSIQLTKADKTSINSKHYDVSTVGRSHQYFFRRPISKIKDAMELFDSFGRELSKPTNSQEPIVLNQNIRILNAARQSYVQLCEAYLTRSKATAHLDLTQAYLKNLSLLADNFSLLLSKLKKGDGYTWSEFDTDAKKLTVNKEVFLNSDKNFAHKLDSAWSATARLVVINQISDHMTITKNREQPKTSSTSVSKGNIEKTSKDTVNEDSWCFVQ